MTTTATTAAAVRDRAVGRSALLRPPGDDRRAEPDRRHEQPAISRSPSTTATSRPETAPPAPPLPPSAATPCTFRRSASSTRSKRRRCSPRATTTGPIATGPRTAASIRSSGSTTSARSSSPRRSRSERPAAPGSADRRRCAWASAARRRASRTAAGPSAASPTRRSTSRARATTCATPRPTRPSARPATPPTSPGCSDAFATPRSRGSAAVMLIAQADPGWDLSDGDARAAARSEDARRNRRPARRLPGVPDRAARRSDRVPQAGRLRARRLALLPRRPAVPGLRSAAGSRTSRRVETFGDNQGNGNNDVHWLKVLVDPRSREVFSYQAQIVPANRTAVPAP